MSDLPPLDQSQAYVVVGPNDQRGPYTMELLISEVLAGRLSEATPVWWPGLADWTTMGGHPGVSAELARRRSSTPAGAPAWADQGAQPQADPYAQPAADPYAQPAADPYAQPAADPYAQPAADPYAQVIADPFGITTDSAGDPGIEAAVASEVVDDGAPGATDDPSTPGDPRSAAEAGEQPVDADVIEIDEVVAIDPRHGEVFAAFVARSVVRAEVQARVDAVNEQLIAAVVAGVGDQDLSLTERVEVDRGFELRFDGASGDLVMVSLGKATASRAEDLRDDHVPVTASYRSSSSRAPVDAGTGEHGEVQVSADEWTGQSTSTVSLFIALGDYLDDQLTVDAESLRRDVGATVAVLRSRLT